MKLAIADPPYPPSFAERFDLADGSGRLTVRSRSRRWYGDQAGKGGNNAADFHPAAAEWDALSRHRTLIEQLVEEYDGWVIATTPDGIGAYQPLPVSAQLLVWQKLRALPSGRRVATSWEAVIAFVPEARRPRIPGQRQVPDLLTAAAPAVGFPGAKPEAWTRWVLDVMGYDAATDTVADLFPGSGAITRVLEGCAS